MDVNGFPVRFDMSSKVKVFKPSPVWDEDRPWFMVPAHILKDLYIATYDCQVDEFGDVESPEQCIREIVANHPDCVLVY